MDYMKDIREISDEQAVILWQASRLSLSGKYEKAPEILSVKGSVIGTLGNFSASIGKAKSKKTFNVSAIVAALLNVAVIIDTFMMCYIYKPLQWQIIVYKTKCFFAWVCYAA